MPRLTKNPSPLSREHPCKTFIILSRTDIRSDKHNGHTSLSQFELQKNSSKNSSGSASGTPEKNAAKAASSFMAAFQAGKTPDFRHIDILTRMALSRQSEENQPGLSHLYGTVIEGLCNDFSETGTETCDRVLLRILQRLDDIDGNDNINQILSSLGQPSIAGLLELRRRYPQSFQQINISKEAVQKIVILSRVTIGADVAITSVFLQRLIQFFPNAEFILAGPSHLADLFTNAPRTRFITIDYRRYGTIVEKTLTWPDLHTAIKNEIQGLGPEQYLAFDTDSRLSQLGLLPPAPPENTFFFHSRGKTPGGDHISLSEMANLWLDKVLGVQSDCHPAVFLHEDHHTKAAGLKNSLDASAKFITMNLGVGGNEKKRVPDPFEELLIFNLLSRGDVILLLDSGRSPESRQRVLDLLEKAESEGFDNCFRTQDEMVENSIDFSSGIIGFRGSMGAIGAVIGKADAFFGYDSSCQHIAAAVGTPSVVAFAGAPNDRFKARWAPQGSRSKTTIVHVDNIDRLNEKEISGLAEQIAGTLYQKAKNNRS